MGIFLNQSKYALESLQKYGMETCEPADTSMREKSKLDEDPQGKVVDPTRYREMIDTLMYLVGNKMHTAFPLQGESSNWQYKFPLPVEGVPTASGMEIPLPGVCTAMMKKLPVKDKWQLH
nr:hypothetical protein [Tanacetum cinerariifolium]